MRHRSLFKCYGDPQWAEAFLDGWFRFRSLNYFRDYEDQVRGDPNEGRSIFRPPGGLVVHNKTQGTTFSLPGTTFESAAKEAEIFVFCLSRGLTTAMWKGFKAAVCIETTNVGAFLARVQDALPRNASFIGPPSRVGWQVRYYDHAQGPGGRWAQPGKIAISKTWDYSWQDEFRLVFSLTDALAFENVRVSLTDNKKQSKFSAPHAYFDVHTRGLRDICRVHNAPVGNTALPLHT